jgi:hypothetical protein
MTEKTADLETVLSRVRKLIERADHAGTPEAEADACRTKADRMMLDYAITEAQLDATRPAAQRTVPEVSHFTVCEASHPLSRFYANLVSYLASHCRCRVVFYNLTDSTKSAYGRTRVTAVGFPSDLRYLELLFTLVMLHMSGEMEPTPDPAKSFDENVYDLHEAGVKWRRIADLMNAASVRRERPGMRVERTPGTEHWWKAVRPSKDQPDYLVPWPDGHRLINAYRRHCALIGEEPRAIVSPVTYQRNFAEGYVSRINSRLYAMRKANDGVAGTSLALRTEDVDAKYADMFPDLKTIKHKEHRYDHTAQMAGREAGDRADLSGGNKVDGKRRELS